MCLVAHRAFTEPFHFSRSAAATRTSSHEPQPPSLLSFFMVLLHVVLALPLLLSPSGANVIATLPSLSLFCLKIWPINFHLLILTSSLSGFISALSSGVLSPGMILFSLTCAPLAFESLFCRSFIPPPSLLTFAPRYVSSSSSSIACQSTAYSCLVFRVDS